MAIKILVVGPIASQFECFDKVTKLCAKNKLDIVLISGDLFSAQDVGDTKISTKIQDLLDGIYKFTVPTYFTIGLHGLPKIVQERIVERDGDLCPNLMFLERRTALKTADGLKIVVLGGRLDESSTSTSSPDRFIPLHTAQEASILKGHHDADIVLTNVWPKDVARNSLTAPSAGVQNANGEQCLAELCTALKPRYLLSSTSEMFWEREPFFHTLNNDDSQEVSVTRFVSVAEYGNASKAKWLYAFSIEPGVKTKLPLPDGLTRTPFDPSAHKRKPLSDQNQPYKRFALDRPSHGDHHASRRRGKGHTREDPPGPESCFFCLANPRLETHLIVSIGDESYMTTAKGPLTEKSTFQSFRYPSHLLIVPLSHEPTFTHIISTESRSSTFLEMTKFRQTAQHLIAEASKGALGTICWEISMPENIHVHWQLLAIPSDMITKGLVEAGLQVEAENQKYPGFETKDIGQGNEQGRYLRVWIWNTIPQACHNVDAQSTGPFAKSDGHEKSLVMEFSSEIRFDLQFPRKVLAKLLGLEHRMQWRDCAQSQEDEMLDANQFKSVFKDVDFTTA